jgi:hypothetical protein
LAPAAIDTDNGGSSGATARRETMAGEGWTVKDLMEALKRFPAQAKVYYEMGPNGPGTIGEAQYVKVWGDEEMGVLLEK